MTQAGFAPQESSIADLLTDYRNVRRSMLALCDPLTPEDMMVQSCAEASPAKWHLAHTSWFFETFLLREFLPGYRPYHPDFLWLFNSYYNSVSDQPQKKLRASFSRPGLAQILEYRAHVDAGIEALLGGTYPEEVERRLVLGLHHEQQHGELLLTDIKHALWSNPLRPAYRDEPLRDLGTHRPAFQQRSITPPSSGLQFPGGLQHIGHSGSGFCFDNELPRHKVWLEDYCLEPAPVSCGQFLQFMEDGGYSRPDLWLAEGWDLIQREGWQAPLYWHRSNTQQDWTIFTLLGDLPLSSLMDGPVCHISYFEADAFARWAGMRLPTEAEWEVAADTISLDPADLLDGGSLHPQRPQINALLPLMYGGVWEWTASAYLGYPGYAAVPGALGEYNGKFMSNQMVLRGGSIATPASHIRSSYRNFFPPHTRWQFSGIRMASLDRRSERKQETT